MIRGRGLRGRIGNVTFFLFIGFCRTVKIVDIRAREE
jgi:hypothetical protein